ncbi:hypothetical protein B0A55_00745 [Friedmanniomyces simplex]|uniref:Uncharacterized protein n=1 Tax=Friedmanniomyces simplex TaxID=329884 RepID=A0A4U0Y029_9PEZI|nr:hypothetical protein B0A55_00745 [Friedmanniomyces simplex]
MTSPTARHSSAFATTPAPTPILTAYRVPADKAWDIFSMLRASRAYYANPRQLLAAMNDEVPQLLFVCSSNELGPRPVEWLYATFGSPDKTNFVVGRIAQRLRLEPLEVDVMAEPEDLGWREMLELIAARVEAGRKAFDASHAVDKHFADLVIPRLLRVARTRAKPAESAGMYT